MTAYLGDETSDTKILSNALDIFCLDYSKGSAWQWHCQKFAKHCHDPDSDWQWQCLAHCHVDPWLQSRNQIEAIWPEPFIWSNFFRICSEKSSFGSSRKQMESFNSGLTHCEAKSAKSHFNSSNFESAPKWVGQCNGKQLCNSAKLDDYATRAFPRSLPTWRSLSRHLPASKRDKCR